MPKEPAYMCDRDSLCLSPNPDDCPQSDSHTPEPKQLNQYKQVVCPGCGMPRIFRRIKND